MRRLPAFVVTLVLALTGSSRAQDVVNGDVGAALDRALRQATLDQFWGAVLVARNGEMLLAKGYGAANEALTPNSARSLFDIGSVTKCFTAAAVLRLEQDGKLSIDDPIIKFYPDAPLDKETVTIRHLLNHTSGIPQEGTDSAYSNGDDRETVANGLLKPRRVSRPGEVFRYSNAGYFLLAAVVEKASGTTWEKYVTEQVLRPAGMKDSGCCGDETLQKDLLTARQDEHWSINGDAATWPYPLAWGYKGAGGVVSSVQDMYAWDRALRTDAVLNAAAREKMFTPAKNSFAMGWEVKGSGNGRVATHTGAVRGYLTSMTRWLEQDACVIVLTNQKQDPVFISQTLTQVLFPAMVEKTAFIAETAGYEKGEYGQVVYPDGVAVSVEAAKEEGSVRLRAMAPDKLDPFLKIMLSPGAAQAFAGKLEAAIDGVKARGASAEKKGVKVEVYTARYNLKPDEAMKIEGKGVSLEAMAGLFHEEPGWETMVLVYLKDDSKNMLSMFMKLERGTAEELLQQLKKAAGL